ncbi:hypothetical protein VKT23_018730 [Stygiomarasmius scandens]|uniref:DUF6593 domain-containing protein n=1 Tax=Marasmiellus scandens TaxID=2682957 RepID=A0ABR1IN75_9AGAR
MELSLSKRRVANAVFFSPDGSAVYHTDTSARLFGRRKTKIYRGKKQIGVVQLHPWSTDVVDVQGRSVNPHRAHLGTSSEVFTASDGHSYKWKVPLGTSLTLYSNDHSSHTIARYDHGSHGIFSRSRPPTLFIESKGVHIADEIITTFVYMMRKREHRSSAAGAAAAGASA